MIEAQRRYRLLGDKGPDYEAFCKEYYCREAILADAHVVSLAYDPPRVLEWNEVMRTDLYELAVDYGDCLSKVWPEPPKPKAGAYNKEWHERRARERLEKYGCLPDNPKRYYDPKPCKRCQGHVRLIRSGTCAACDTETAKRYADRLLREDLGI